MKTLLMFIGFFHLFFFSIGMLGLCQYRVYIGTKDVVLIPKEEYAKLKGGQ